METRFKEMVYMSNFMGEINKKISEKASYKKSKI